MNQTKLALLIATAMILGGLPATVTAHPEDGVDTHTAFDETWNVFGPQGETAQLEDALREGDLHAELRGGQQSPSCTHHVEGLQGDHEVDDHSQLTSNLNECTNTTAGDVNYLSAFQCNGPSLDDPSQDADADMYTTLAFNHSDVKNGITEATGSFFVDVYLEGAAADRVDQVWFSYLHTFPWPVSSALCQGPLPMPGVFYEFYRGDTDGANGWEIPINTLLVPDAPYGAVVRALDTDTGTTVAASFSYSYVNNYHNEAEWTPGGTPEECNKGQSSLPTRNCPYRDSTPPHAVVKGANGNGVISDEPANTECLSGGGDVAVEYGEPLATGLDTSENPGASFTVDKDVSITTYDPVERDVDSTPASTTETNQWGPGFCLDGVVGNEVMIKAVDQNGNVGVQKVIDSDTVDPDNLFLNFDG